MPADVSLTIDRYIAAARRIDDENATSVSGYVEAVIGYDTNVNAGPNKSEVVIPGFGGLPYPRREQQANTDWFGSVGGGVNVATPLAPGIRLLAGVTGSQRFNARKDQFDTTSGDANIGVSTTRDQDVFGDGASQYGQRRVTVSAMPVPGSGSATSIHRNQLGAFLQYSICTIADRTRDADRWVAGASYAHLYREAPLSFLSGYAVNERPQLGLVAVAPVSAALACAQAAS